MGAGACQRGEFCTERAGLPFYFALESKTGPGCTDSALLRVVWVAMEMGVRILRQQSDIAGKRHFFGPVKQPGWPEAGLPEDFSAFTDIFKITAGILQTGVSGQIVADL